MQRHQPISSTKMYEGGGGEGENLMIKIIMFIYFIQGMAQLP